MFSFKLSLLIPGVSGREQAYFTFTLPLPVARRTPEITFGADRPFRLFNVEFRPRRKSTDTEFKETSVVVLPILILLGFAVINFNKIWPSVAALVGKTSSAGHGASRTSLGAGSRSEEVDSGLPDLSWVEGTTAAGAAKKKVKAKRA
jgi:hypothetical protein